MANQVPIKHTPKGAAFTALALSIFRVNGRLMRAGDDLLKDLGVTSARWQVLGCVESRSLTVARIARSFDSTRQGVLWVVTALVKDGLVELIDNPDHKRAKLVKLTESGTKICKEMKTRQIAWANRIGSSFSLDELGDAVKILGQLGKEVHASDRVIKRLLRLYLKRGAFSAWSATEI